MQKITFAARLTLPIGSEDRELNLHHRLLTAMIASLFLLAGCRGAPLPTPHSRTLPTSLRFLKHSDRSARSTPALIDVPCLRITRCRRLSVPIDLEAAT